MTTDAKTQLRRLSILQLLMAEPGYSLNDTLLQTQLSQCGHGVAAAVVLADMAWLEQVGLLSVSTLPACSVAVLRQDGLDVANGVSSIPGIARPRP